jgi:release factor glutamine methyltransferase
VSSVDLETLRREAIAALAAAGITAPDIDVDLLIGHVLALSRGAVQAKAITRAPIGASDAVAIRSAVGRRAAREPLQHITGIAPFRSLELEVGPGVFTPRPETELVVQFAIDALALTASPHPLAVDLGTGSGAIALAMATEVPHSRVVAVERSPEAFAFAARNVARYGDDRVRLVLADLADALPELDGTVDVVASNPPYIPRAAVPKDPEVRLFDPPAALYSGDDGLDAVRALATTARRLLRPGGTLVLEHGELQAQAVADLLRGAGLTAIAGHRDLTGRDRATTAIR